MHCCKETKKSKTRDQLRAKRGEGVKRAVMNENL